MGFSRILFFSASILCNNINGEMECAKNYCIIFLHDKNNVLRNVIHSLRKLKFLVNIRFQRVNVRFKGVNYINASLFTILKINKKAAL